MLETSARLLQLLGLFQGRRYWAGKELAARLEVTDRTLRRDIDKLRSLGYAIQATPGVEGGYQLDAPEAPPAPAYEDMVVRAGNAETVDGRTLAAIVGACRRGRSLRFGYENHQGEASARDVEPHRLVHGGGRWYLVAWDRGRKEWRTFRVDRVRARPAVGDRFEPRKAPAEDLVAYVRKGVWLAPPCRARVKLLESAESVVERLRWFAGMTEPVDARSCVVEMGAKTWEEMAARLAWLGADFEVEGPAELRREVAKLGRRYARAVKGRR